MYSVSQVTWAMGHRLCSPATAAATPACVSAPRQVIEKAYKKLRLDALVIQQGRLTENQGSKVS